MVMLTASARASVRGSKNGNIGGERSSAIHEGR